MVKLHEGEGHLSPDAPGLEEASKVLLHVSEPEGTGCVRLERWKMTCDKGCSRGEPCFIAPGQDQTPVGVSIVVAAFREREEPSACAAGEGEPSRLFKAQDSDVINAKEEGRSKCRRGSLLPRKVHKRKAYPRSFVGDAGGHIGESPRCQRAQGRGCPTEGEVDLCPIRKEVLLAVPIDPAQGVQVRKREV